MLCNTCYNMGMNEPKIELLTPQKYISEAIELLAKAERRVFLIGLLMYRDNVTTDFVDALLATAKRGVEVHIAADFATFSFGLNKNELVKSGVRVIRDSSKLSREFRQSGAKFRWLGRNYGTLFASRTHSKWLVVDDTVFAFGGVNTDDEAIVMNNDYMFRVDDATLADTIEKEHREIERADRTKRLTRNHREKSSIGTVLFDDGHPGRSIIYNTAADLAKEADSLTLVSQYQPTGRLAGIIRRKEDAADLYFNPLSNAENASNKFMLLLGKNDLRKKNLYKSSQYLHAKFIIFNMEDGRKIALTGSHNFVAAGSRIGTREVALLTENKRVIAELEKFFAEKVLK